MPFEKLVVKSRVFRHLYQGSLLNYYTGPYPKPDEHSSHIPALFVYNPL
jgi:hypothetical protein